MPINKEVHHVPAFAGLSHTHEQRSSSRTSLRWLLLAFTASDTSSDSRRQRWYRGSQPEVGRVSSGHIDTEAAILKEHNQCCPLLVGAQLVPQQHHVLRLQHTLHTCTFTPHDLTPALFTIKLTLAVLYTILTYTQYTLVLSFGALLLPGVHVHL